MAEVSVRFSVGDGMARASTWKCWTNVGTGKSDVYLANRQLANAFKASLHQSGQWHIAFDKHFLETSAVPDEWPTRFQDVWIAPAESPPGFIAAFRVVTMRGSVNIPIEAAADANIVWVSPPPDDLALEIDVLILSRWDGIGWPGRDSMNTSLVGQLQREDGSTVFIVSHLVSKPAVALTANKGRFFYGKTEADLRSENLRAILFGTEPDGSRVMYDVAIIRTESDNAGEK